jgi:hypothetical protein
MTFSIARLSPRALLALDAGGALVTATLLGVVLVRYAAAFGIPPSVFRWLAAGVLFYFVYSATAALLNPARWVRAIRVIAVANALYSVVTLTMVVILRERITTLGTVYFVGEALLILGIAAAEWRYTTRATPEAFGRDRDR